MFGHEHKSLEVNFQLDTFSELDNFKFRKSVCYDGEPLEFRLKI